MEMKKTKCTICGSEVVDRLLNQQEVAEIISVSTRTLEHWRTVGLGPVFVKIGKLARYRMSDVQTYVAELNEYLELAARK